MAELSDLAVHCPIPITDDPVYGSGQRISLGNDLVSLPSSNISLICCLPWRQAQEQTCLTNTRAFQRYLLTFNIAGQRRRSAAVLRCPDPRLLDRQETPNHRNEGEPL